MADATFLYAETATDVTASSTTYVDVCEISAGSFTAGKTYFILAEANVGSGSGSDNNHIRLVHGTTPTAFTDATAVYEMTASRAQVTRIGFLYVYTQPDPAELVKLQVANSATSNTVSELGQIFALKLSDDFTENTDYFYNEVTANYTTTTSFAAQAAVTFTPNGTDDWWIVGHAVVQPGSVTVPYRMSIHDSVLGLDEPSLELEGEDVVNVEARAHNISFAYTPSAASHTVSVRFNHTTTASTVLSSRIFAINLNKFAQHAYTYAAAEETPATTPSWTTTRTLSPTPDTTGDWFIHGYVTNDVNTSGDTMAMRLQINASGGGLASNPNYGDDNPKVDGWDSSDQVPESIFKMLSLSSGASREINLGAQVLSGTALRIQERTLVAFSKALAATATAKPKTLTMLGVG